MRTGREWGGQEGIVLLEVLFAGVILGIAVIGISLMLSRAQTMVVGQGDRYVSLYLAQQKIESLTATALQNPPTSCPLPPPAAGSGFMLVGPMGTSTEANLQAGEQAGTVLQRFTRTTCVNYVNDDDPSTPSTCTNCTGGGTCTNCTKRITVTVTPALPEADPVTLVTVITAHP